MEQPVVIHLGLVLIRLVRIRLVRIRLVRIRLVRILIPPIRLQDLILLPDLVEGLVVSAVLNSIAPSN